MNENPNIESCESQNKSILAYLREGHRLTQLEAYNLFGCVRLPSRIHDISKRCCMLTPNEVMDYEWISVSNKKKKVKQYFLRKVN